MSEPRNSSEDKVWRLRDGGWMVLAFAALFLAATVAVLIELPRWRSETIQPAGNTYGLDLSNLRVPRDQIFEAGYGRAKLDPLIEPPTLTVAEADEFSYGGHGRTSFLVSGDRVVGIEINGEARAWPLSLLNWHEAVNDTLGGEPILVAYCPLTDSAAIFDRRVGGETRQFGISGLLYNSNSLYYDDVDEALWQQISGRAISGPEPGAGMGVLPAQLTDWGRWKKRYPETTVMRPDMRYRRNYRRSPFSTYRADDDLRFPVDPLPRDSDLELKDRVVSMRVDGGDWTRFPLRSIAEKADASGVWSADVGDVEVVFQWNEESAAILYEFNPSDAPLETIHSYWFAWHAFMEK